MKINVCVNGTFRYPQYIRHYDEADVLDTFYYAHRRSLQGAALGFERAIAENIWPKEYLLRAAFHLAPGASRLSTAICDVWQRAVIRRWRDCDSAEVVIGAVADQVIAFARGQGTRVLGHPVTAHPATVTALVGEAYAMLGLDPARGRVTDRSRRAAEIAGCDAFIADSAFVARSFVEAGVPADRIAVIRPGVVTTRFQARRPDEIDRTRFRVVCVGIVTPRKAQHLLLQAWRRLNLPKAELILVGALGRDAGAVLRGFAGTFTHIPFIDNARLRDLLITASAFVLPSVEDGFGQAPWEAMACGIPTIVSANVGMADAITDGVDGFVVPPFDVDALAARIEALYRDQALAATIGAAAAQTVHQACSWADYAGAVIDRHRALIAPSETTREAA